MQCGCLPASTGSTVNHFRYRLLSTVYNIIIEYCLKPNIVTVEYPKMTSESSSVRAPRIASMARGGGGYGFNLHGERGVVGQFVSAVDGGGVADQAGLCVGDRIIEVNGVNVESATHSQVVAKVREDPEKTTLLVIDKVTDDFLKQHNIPVSAELASVDSVLSLDILQQDKDENKSENSDQDNKIVECSPTYEEIKSAEQDLVDAPQKEVEVQNTPNSEEELVKLQAQKEVANVPLNDEVEQDVPEIVIQQDDHEVIQQNAPRDPADDADQNVVNATENENVTTEPVAVEQENALPLSENHVTEQNGRSDEHENLGENISTSKTYPEPEIRPQVEQQNPETVKEEIVSNSTNGGLQLTSMAAALPKPKRKSIKEEKAGSWASKAAMFNNL